MRQLLAASLFLLTGLAARADTISSFTFQGSSVTYGLAEDFNTVTGAFSVDITTGVVQTVSLTAEKVFSSGVFSQVGPEVFVGSAQNALSFSAASLIAYQGSTFNLRTPDDLYVGSTTLASSSSTPIPAVVPEPSAISLLATGIAGTADILRRRRRRSCSAS